MTYFGYDHGEDDLIARERETKRRWSLGICIGIVLFWAAVFWAVSTFIGPCEPAHAQGSAPEFTNENAIRSIIGEARGESFKAQKAHAHAIQNRGNLRGVYGFNDDLTYTKRYFDKKRKRWLKVTVREVISPELYQQISRAWFEAMEEDDFTLGSTEWRSKADIEKEQKNPRRWQKFLAEFEETIQEDDTTFYRRKKK